MMETYDNVTISDKSFAGRAGLRNIKSINLFWFVSKHMQGIGAGQVDQSKSLTQI